MINRRNISSGRRRNHSHSHQKLVKEIREKLGIRDDGMSRRNRDITTSLQARCRRSPRMRYRVRRERNRYNTQLRQSVQRGVELDIEAIGRFAGTTFLYE